MRHSSKKRRTARVVNPARKRRRARVLNPSLFDVLSNPATELERADEIFETFRGRPSEFITDYEVGPGVPRTLAELGGLLEIETVDGDIHLFEPEEVRLCADADGNLRIAGRSEEPDGDEPEGSEVVRIDYVADKPHLYDEDEIEFTHTWGEEIAGACGPVLTYEDGFFSLDPDTGDYEITKDGIQDAKPGRERNGFFSSLADTAVGGKWEVEAFEQVEPTPTVIGTFRARTKKEALRQAKAQARKEAPAGTFTRFKATRV